MDSIKKYFASTIDVFGLDYSILGNEAWKYIVAVVLCCLLYLGVSCLKIFFRSRLAALSKKESIKEYVEPFHIALSKTLKIFILFFSIYCSVNVFELHGSIDVFFKKAFLVITFLQIGIWLDTLSSRFVHLWLTKSGNLPVSSTTLGLLKFAARAVSWVLVALILLDNLGIDVTALVAGLGIGGIAVALAVQSVLGDLLCSLSIALDEPFEAGDFIIFGTVKGTVERIGIRSTRIRSLSGEQIIVSNSDLIKGQIQNYKRMEERRISFAIGVTYQTSSDKLRKIPDIIKQVVESKEEVRFDRSHFLSFGDSALIFETIYFVLSPDFNRYADIQQSINLDLFSEFENEEIEFAYPTQTLYLENLPKEKSESLAISV